MSLADRRSMEDYKSNKYPEWVKEINTAAGYELNFDIPWEALTIEGEASNYANMLDYGYFFPIKKALESICQDTMGKEALKATISHIRLAHNPVGHYIDPSFDNDTLVVSTKMGYVQSENWTNQSIHNLIEGREKKL